MLYLDLTWLRVDMKLLLYYLLFPTLLKMVKEWLNK